MILMLTSNFKWGSKILMKRQQNLAQAQSLRVRVRGSVPNRNTLKNSVKTTPMYNPQLNDEKDTKPNNQKQQT